MRHVSRRLTIAGLGLLLLGGALIAYVFVLRGSLGPLLFEPDIYTASATIHSTLLDRDMAVEVFRPPAAQTCDSGPILYLFHGSGADERQWMAGDFGTGVGIDTVARRLIDNGRIRPVTIVSASIDKSYGVDSPPSADTWSHGPYESYILEELLPQIESSYSVGDSADRAIGGLSMGGFAALNAAFRNPAVFGSVAALSPAFFVSPPADRAWIYSGGDGRHDPLMLAKEGVADGMHVFLGYGDSDYEWVRDATAQLDGLLTARGTTVHSVVVNGGHDVGTWRQLAEPMLLDLFPTSDTPC